MPSSRAIFSYVFSLKVSLPMLIKKVRFWLNSKFFHSFIAIGKKYEVCTTALHPTNWNQKVAQQKNNFFPSKTFKNQI